MKEYKAHTVVAASLNEVLQSSSLDGWEMAPGGLQPVGMISFVLVMQRERKEGPEGPAPVFVVCYPTDVRVFRSRACAEAAAAEIALGTAQRLWTMAPEDLLALEALRREVVRGRNSESIAYFNSKVSFDKRVVVLETEVRP